MDTSSFKNFVSEIIAFIGSLVLPTLITLIVFVFIFNVARYISKGDDPKERQNAAKYMLWSVIGLFLIFSLWGIMALLRNTAGIASPLPLFPEA